MGIPQLDTMLNGGLPKGHSVLVLGPSGTGKTILGTTYLAEGARRGGKGVMAFFDQGNSRSRNAELAKLAESNSVSIVESRSFDLSIEEILDDLVHEITRTGATRVVIDALSELALYLAPEFAQDFRGSVFKILATLARLSVSVVLTIGQEDSFANQHFGRADTAFLADAIIALRYVEMEGCMTKVMSVVKVRGSNHSSDLHQYAITDAGINIDERPMKYEGLLSGHPSPITPHL